MTTNEVAERLIPTMREMVREHYSSKSTPLLLSALGKMVQEKHLWQGDELERKRLREVIEEANDPDLVIVRDPSFPAYVAVATSASKENVQQFIERRSRARTTVPDIGALPRSLVLAFCVKVEQGQRVFLRKSPPYKYTTEISDGESPELYWVIDERYRRPGLRVTDIEKLAEPDRLDLQTKIATWSRDNDVQLEKLYKPLPTRHANALQRFLSAQPPGIVEKLLIPGDIALILSQHE